MAVATQLVSIKSSDGWVKVADGATNVLVQQQDGMPVQWWAGTAAPAGSNTGLALPSDGLSIAGLTTGDQIYCRVGASSSGVVDSARVAVLTF